MFTRNKEMIKNNALIRNVKRVFLSSVMLLTAFSTTAVSAAEYDFDIEGAHAFVQFRVQHLGYSWLYGRFNKFDGEFSYDPEHPENSSVSAEIDMTSLDSNHAERDKHLRSDDYLNVKKYPSASFKSSAYKVTGEGTGILTGDLTFFGSTHSIDLEIEHIGGGDDPWGGYRHGFEGRALLRPAIFGLDLVEALGMESAATIEIFLTVEGIEK